MPSLLDIRRRIRAVKSTQQITKAMKMVAASKLRRSQERIQQARPFASQMLRVLNSLAARVDPAAHPLLDERRAPRAGGRVLLFVITADRDLCGSLKLEDARAIAKEAIEAFTGGAVDSVYLVYNEFKSVMNQRVVVERLLPIPRGTFSTEAEQPQEAVVDYLYE